MKYFLRILPILFWLTPVAYGARVQVEQRSQPGSARTENVSQESPLVSPRSAVSSNNSSRVTVQPSTTRQTRWGGYPGSYSRQRYVRSYRNGVEWYGFHHGRSLYWTRYWGNHWWWYDNQFNRWAFWASGYWWWRGPGGVLYVYVNDDYSPYDASVVAEYPAAIPQAPPQDSIAPATPAAPASPSHSDNTWNSPDGKRMVQTVGTQGEAFLYDTSSGKPVFMKYLAKGVERVRFNGGTNALPLQILVDFTDGQFALYDANGAPRS